MEPQAEGLATIVQTESVSGKTGLIPESGKAEKKLEQNMTSRKEATAKLKSALDIINSYLDQGLFGDAGEDKYNQAKTALSYKGTGGDSDRETSNQIRAMIDSVREIAGKDPQAQEISDYFTKNIKVFNQTEGKTYSLDGWEEQINVIQNDNSLSEEERSHKIEGLETEARYGFLLQKEETRTQEQQKPAEDRLIENSIDSIKKEIDRLKAAGQDTKEKEAFLASLELANNANGELGIFFKAHALNKLKTAGYEEANGELVERLIKESSPVLEKATGNLEIYLEKCNISKEQKNQLMDVIQKRGDIEQLIMGGYFDKVEGLDQLIFAKKMTEQELLQLLSGQKKVRYLLEKYGKKGLWALLLALLLGTVQAADLAKGELGAR